MELTIINDIDDSIDLKKEGEKYVAWFDEEFLEISEQNQEITATLLTIEIANPERDPEFESTQTRQKVLGSITMPTNQLNDSEANSLKFWLSHFFDL